jgi:hypothetical protein
MLQQYDYCSAERDKPMRIEMKLLFAMTLFACVSPSWAQEAGVPKLYHDLYQSLDAKLTLAVQCFGKPDTAFQPTFGVELTKRNE